MSAKDKTIEILRDELAAERERVDVLLDRLAAKTLAEYHAVQGPPAVTGEAPTEWLYDDTGLIRVPRDGPE